jgi:subtilisin family serine protease
MTRSKMVALLGLMGVLGCGEFDAAGPGADLPDPFQTSAAEPYVVTVSPNASAAMVAHSQGIDPDAVFSHALNGFVARIPRQAVAGILRNPHVQSVEADGPITGDTQVQADPTWGLDRIDQRELPLDNGYSYAYTGHGVTAYIIDSGIRFDHVDFEGRAKRGFDAFSDGQDGSDCRGHGTHVAGTVGGRTWGVAKSVRLVSVRVLDCNGRGTVSGAIAGIDWIIRNNAGPAVANMSLGAAKNESLNQAVRNLAAAGVQVSVAAGNSDTDACTVSPASTREAITVGSAGSSRRNVRRPYSNWGDCVDVFAPGSEITSASHLDPVSSVVMSGTSMAAPHAAGVMALWLEAEPTLMSAQLHQLVIANATQDIVEDAKSANAHMLHSLRDGAASLPPPSSPPPSASFSAACEDTDCAFTDESSPAASIVAWAWDLGDGSTSSARNPARHYAKAGTYTVVQTVTDDMGLTDTAARTILVTEPVEEGIQLSASGSQHRGVRRVVLSWSGASAASVDLFRNDQYATVPNTGSYVDEFKGGGAVTYTVCDAGTIRCSPEVTVQF